MPVEPPPFVVVPGADVQRVLRGQEKRVVELVEEAYGLHGAGQAVNPHSHFLRFPDRPASRIIALPASLRGDTPVDGLKWVSSFPANVSAGLPRASAVLILNDPATGYPLACMEGSIISAARTAASAALAADLLSEGRPRPTRVGFVGAGLIARYIHTYLVATGWRFDTVGVHDLSAEHAAGFLRYVARGAGEETRPRTVTFGSAEALIRSCDLVVFATVAGEPHVTDPSWFGHDPLVLHISLRDLAPEIMLGAVNVVDDVDHCLRMGTSLHLTEQRTGHRDFVAGTLYDVMTRGLVPPRDRPLIFSPFGLGVLDLAVGRYVLDRITAENAGLAVPRFFHELDRYG
jgi:ornithine cyclodeaminase